MCRRPPLLALGAILLAGASSSGCGGSDKAANELKHEQEVRAARSAGRQDEKLRELQRQLREKKSGSSQTGSNGSTGSSGTGGSTEFNSCDANISVKAGTTTCLFGENVFYEYWTNNRASNITVYSPSTRQTYITRCSESGIDVLCATDQGAGIKFPTSALDGYTQAQADRYAATHQVAP
jgi:hypothetical protein